MITENAPQYIGRFAPSPTGPLHFGSLVAALASFLDAHHNRGQWLVRMEDIDPPREQPNAAKAILNSLEAHHLNWDGEVLYQSARSPAYREALDLLEQKHLTFRCICSRLELHGQPVYDGHCRHLAHSDQTFSSIRLNILSALKSSHCDSIMTFEDSLLNTQQQNMINEVGDFIIHRKDGFFAYQLAVVVDDIFQGITHVIRGADLLDSTPHQILLFKLFGTAIPHYGHIPLATNLEGQKLSKQNHAPALNHQSITANLFSALIFLKQNPPKALARATADEILRWAIIHWQLASLRSLQ